MATLEDIHEAIELVISGWECEAFSRSTEAGRWLELSDVMKRIVREKAAQSLLSLMDDLPSEAVSLLASGSLVSAFPRKPRKPVRDEPLRKAVLTRRLPRIPPPEARLLPAERDSHNATS